MKYIISLLVLSFALAVGCKTNKQNSPFSQDKLPTEKFTVNTERDTVLTTQNGALLNIAAGSLETKDGNTVTLEIKEAYSIGQIVKAGLLTESNGEPLSSGGMIYINATGDQKVTIKQRIKVAIPADYLQSG